MIASLASAAAAVIVSQFSVAGTWIAAAITPVFVILIQEALHKPTDVIAERFTSGRTAVLPRGTPSGPPPPGDHASEPPVRVYRSGAGGEASRPRSTKRKLAIGTVGVTAFLAFAIAAFAITGAELVTGGSIGKSNHRTTLWGGSKGSTSQGQDTNTTEQNQQAPGQQQQQQTDQQQKTTTGGSQGNQKTTPTQPGGGGTPSVPTPQTTTP